MQTAFRCAVLVALAACGGAEATPSAPPMALTSAPQAVDRNAAVTSFAQRFADALAAANNDHDDPNIKRLVDANVAVMTSAYVAGGLDDKVSADLMKLLVSMRDPRTSRALAKAFNDYEPGKRDGDVRLAAESVTTMAQASAKLDKAVIDSLWACFLKYQPSKTNSIRGTQALHDAILALKEPSYGEKAIVAIQAPADDTAGPGARLVNDQLEFWQTTALQVIKQLRYKAAAKPLVQVLMTRSKLGIARLAKTAILTMATDAEPFLVAALTGSDPDLAKLQGNWENKSFIPVLLDVLGYTSLTSARDAILAFVPQLDNDTSRAAAAQMLVWFPTTPTLVASFKSLYAKLPPVAEKDDTGAERAQLLAMASELFDPALGPWALREAASAKGTSMLSAKVGAIQSAIKLMRPAEKAGVAKAIADLENSGLTAAEKRAISDNVRAVFASASLALDKCALDVGCYVKVLDDPIPQTANSNWKAIKAATMAGALGNSQTRKDLISHIPTITNPGVRLAVAVAVNHLAPNGDRADADALETIVSGDEARKDSEALKGDDALSKVALMLRARAP